MPDTALFDFMRKAKDASTHLCAPLGSNKNIHIIMGNESCDLDSVVSALCFGLYQDSPDKIVIPLLNIENDEFPLRTEVTYLLHENGVPSNLLVFRHRLAGHGLLLAAGGPHHARGRGRRGGLREREQHVRQRLCLHPLRERGSSLEDRATTFDRIVCARKDVSSLSSFQILHKDMKVVRGVPLPGMPLLVHDFLKRPDVGSALSEFCTKHASAAAVVIGMSFSESSGTSSLRRDLAVYSLGGAEQPAGQLIEALRAEEDLQLSPAPCSIPGVTLFDQRNAKLSRKQILPVVQRVLSAATARA
ncbi:hypothetical protein FOCC_FOCC011016 [Frankliniella occidentalis]|nr:hypothetical protein FOCC_FOCC011016 [Frankliniella occidentalis]